MEEAKNVIISGAASGIGLGLAEFFARSGYNLSLIDKNEIPKINYNVQIDYYKQDITDFRNTEICVREIIDKVGSIAVLINDAGILKGGFLDLSLDEMHDLIHTNLLAHFNLTRPVAKQMKNDKNGYIFNISSRSGLDAKPKLGGYSMSKFGLMGFNEALYEEIVHYNVKVTALAPSVINTPMGKTNDMSEKDMIPVSDIVNTVQYLLNLSENTYIREIYIDCKQPLIHRLK